MYEPKLITEKHEDCNICTYVPIILKQTGLTVLKSVAGRRHYSISARSPGGPHGRVKRIQPRHIWNGSHNDPQH